MWISIPVDCSDWVYAYAFRLDIKRETTPWRPEASLTSNPPAS